MEEKNKGGYTAEGRKLRPRRPRISEGGHRVSEYQGQERSAGSDYSERRSYGSSERRSYSSSDRRSYGSSERRGYGDRPDRRSYGASDRRDDRPAYGERKSSSYGERRPYRQEGGNGQNRQERGGERRFSSEGRPERRSYGSSEGRRFSSEGRSYNQEGRSYNQEGRSYGSGEGRSEQRRSYGAGERRSYGSSDWKPGFAKRNDRGGFRQDRRAGGKPGFGQGRRQGFGKKKNPYSFDEENTGINEMISRKPQVSEMQYSDNDFAAPAFKEEVRLNKYIANSGVCSRREADQMIQAGVVTVNGEVVTELGTKVNVLKDEIKFNGETLKGEEKVYIVMNKPKGYVTTASDPHAERTVMDLLKDCHYRVFPVGRLDKNTTGVLMFTNDGEIAEKLTHPSYDKKKIYQVILDRPVSQEHFDSILSGITLGDGEIKADELEYIDAEDHKKIGIEIHSGKNRIVRRIFESLGYDVKALDRVYFAGLTKKGLKKGEWRYLSEGEANVLKMGAYV